MTAANAVRPDWEQLLLWGFSVFPLLPRDKKAAVPWAAYQKERAAGKLVKQWADDRRGLNAAVVTGAVSGVIVLDTDSADAEAEVQRRGVPRTPTVKTAKGRHRYFTHPGFAVRNFAGRIAGVDLRGDGGYVVAAGSTHPSGAVYAWEITPDEAAFAPVPDWLLDLIRAPPPTVEAAPPPNNGPRSAYAEKALDGELAMLRRAQQGGRNDALNRSAFNLGQLVGGDALPQGEAERHLLATALAIGLNEKEARATIASGIEDGKANPRRIPERRQESRAVGGGRSGAPVAKLNPMGAPRPAPREATGKPVDLIMTETGGVRACLANAIAFLSGAPLSDRPAWRNPLAGALAFDEFAIRTVLQIPPPWHPPAPDWEPRYWEAADDLYATEWLQRQGCMVNQKIVAAAVEAVAHRNGFHPIRRYLNSLVWDGVPRLESWLSDYLNVENTAYAQAVGARWLISAVARIYKPGCQADSCLILEGWQGQKKSSALRILGEPWFTDDLADVTSKDAAMQTAGAWIIEIAELDAFRNAEATRIKDFLTRRIDRFRPPYGERLIENPRQCVFGGTTNAVNGYLQDPTGGRRFWPVRVQGPADLDRLRQARAQLWAEAVKRFHDGEPWWLDDESLTSAAEEEAGQRYEGDSWDTLVSVFISGKPDVSVGDILQGALDIPPERWGKAESMRVGKILTALGWQRRQVRRDHPARREWRYFPPPVTTTPHVTTWPDEVVT